MKTFLVSLIIFVVVSSTAASGTISVSWSQPGSDERIVGYTIQYDLDEDVVTGGHSDEVPVTTTSWTLTSAADCVLTYIHVRSRTDSGLLSNPHPDGSDRTAGYPQPSIASVSYDDVGLIVIDGLNFRDGAVVEVDGVAVPATVVDCSTIRLTQVVSGYEVRVTNVTKSSKKYVWPIPAPSNVVRIDTD